jgi:hypothetical protein
MESFLWKDKTYEIANKTARIATGSSCVGRYLLKNDAMFVIGARNR